jgi:hypothetical protein
MGGIGLRKTPIDEQFDFSNEHQRPDNVGVKCRSNLSPPEHQIQQISEFHKDRRTVAFAWEIELLFNV